MITIMIAGFCPIPTTGTRKARRPILGIDCMIFAIPITTEETFLFFVTRIPRGIPIHMEISTAAEVIWICSRRS